jgi:hypothetical protein
MGDRRKNSDQLNQLRSIRGTIEPGSHRHKSCCSFNVRYQNLTGGVQISAVMNELNISRLNAINWMQDRWY